MRKWKDIREQLQHATLQHAHLVKVFQSIAESAKEYFERCQNHFLDIDVLNGEDTNRFTIVCCGRRIVFLLTSVASEVGEVKGVVTCYLERDFPNYEQREVASFSLDHNGRTDLTDPEHGYTLDFNSNNCAADACVLCLVKAISEP